MSIPSSRSSPTRCSASSGRRAPARTTSCGWRGAAGCSPGPARASTTPSRSGSRGSATSTARKEPGKTRERTVYSLTEKGREALADYARTPVTFTPVKSDALLRLLIADLVGEQVTRESLATLRDDIEELQQRLDDGERTAHDFPHREKYLLLVISFLRRLLDLHVELSTRSSAISRQAPTG